MRQTPVPICATCSDIGGFIRVRGFVLGVSSNAKQSVNDCCFEHWLLEARRFAPHSRRGGAVGTPPSRLSPIPPRASRLFAASLAKCAASPACGSSCLIGEALRGLAPTPPVSLATPRGQGERRKRRAPHHLPTGRVCFGAVRQGVSKKIYKDDEAVFTNLSGRPPPALVKVTGAGRLVQPMRL